DQRDRRGAYRSDAARRISLARSHPGPDKASRQALLIEPRGFVLPNASRQNLRLPGARGSLEAFELPQDRAHGVRLLHPSSGRDTMSLGQEQQKIARSDGLDVV